MLRFKFLAFVTFFIAKLVSGGDTNWFDKLYGVQVDSREALENFRLSTAENGGAGKHIFILFYYSWCHNCQRDQPIITEAERRLLEKPGSNVAFVRVDLDHAGDLLRYFKVRKSPTFAYIGLGSSSDLVYYKFGRTYTVENLVSFANSFIKTA
ncbi:thioredoxin h-type [Stylonychia lemnae]|uniref:Thioredoxin h-type n=1 Tax=Stylonychia lemnae TaxID=5949 RepID=A0A078B0E6_STYLE|nr:thioredoxin h-type [Stylonychia lemnae]|eukprot:CDW88125.1 thioredoxin h-type [Stylonychia lemnae]